MNKLPIAESFYTIQGEGYHSGRAAYFIRLGGCNVACPWCDAKESWSTTKHPHLNIEDLAREAGESGAEVVVITGGEPLMHQLDELCSKLHAAGQKIFLETSGTQPFSGSFDWVCLSPKSHRPPLEESFKKADEIKLIIGREEDLRWAEMCAQKVAPECRLYLQAEWSTAAKITPIIVDYVKSNQRWRISIQSHKYMQIP
ncbi:MAG: 7-carboxy-7-deazaguanine synthase QueE [Rikenellaceae bacterium]